MSYRIRDIVLGGLLLIGLSPFFIGIILLLFFFQDKVWFTHYRPGLHGKLFKMYKFSTLYDAQDEESEQIHQLERIRPIGKYLRKFSLDELPQLWNVLKGDMSLVGPRPLLSEYLPLYTPEERERHLVRPGITGWAQVNGRNCISFKKKFEYDRWYVKHRSHWLDLKIMAMTVLAVFRTKQVNVTNTTTAYKYDGTN